MYRPSTHQVDERLQVSRVEKANCSELVPNEGFLDHCYGPCEVSKGGQTRYLVFDQCWFSEELAVEKAALFPRRMRPHLKEFLQEGQFNWKRNKGYTFCRLPFGCIYIGKEKGLQCTGQALTRLTRGYRFLGLKRPTVLNWFQLINLGFRKS